MAKSEEDDDCCCTMTKASLKPVTKTAPSKTRQNTDRDVFGAFPDQSAVPSDRWKD